MDELVSIITPAFNAEKYIAETINSVVDQSYRNWEMIVIDDGSVDGSADIVRRYSSSDHRIKYIFQQNGGQGEARNTGIRNARGNLIAFLDADDLWVKDKLSLQVQALAEAEADLVFSDGFIFSDDNVADESKRFETITGKFSAREMFDLLFIGPRIPILSVLARKEALYRAGLFDADRRHQMCEDYDLWLKMAKTGSVFVGMNQKLVRYRRHSSASTTNELAHLKAFVNVVKKYKHDASIDERLRRTKLLELDRQMAAMFAGERRVIALMKYFSELPRDERYAFARQAAAAWARELQRTRVGERLTPLIRPAMRHIRKVKAG